MYENYVCKFVYLIDISFKSWEKFISKTFQNNIQKTLKYSSKNSINPTSNMLMDPKLSPKNNFKNFEKLFLVVFGL